MRSFIHRAAAAALFASPASLLAQDVAIRNATIITIARGDIANGNIVVRNGKITAVGAGVAIPQGIRVIDVRHEQATVDAFTVDDYRAESSREDAPVDTFSTGRALTAAAFAQDQITLTERAGLTLGTVLGTIGFLRIVLWQAVTPTYGEHYLLVAITVFGSLIGVVTFGTVAGSFLPFLLRRFGFDPASASAPFVATLVDVTGLVIYFTIASLVLRGTLL